MNLDIKPTAESRRETGAWLFSFLFLGLVIGYLAWTVLSKSFDAAQGRWHPLLAARAIARQITGAAPPWEWNLPIWSLVTASAWAIGTMSCGWWLVGRRLGSKLPISARATLAFACGFTVIGWLQAVLALMGGARLSLIPVVFIAGAGALVFNKGVARDMKTLRSAFCWQWQRLNIMGRMLAITGAVGLSLMLVPALTPPIQSDGVRYHLGAPQEFLKAGNFDYLPLNAYSNMPFLVEMHFMAALGLHAPEATQLMHIMLAVMAAMGIYAVTRILWAPAATASGPAASGLKLVWLIAPLLYISAPMSAVLATWPFTDHGIALMLVSSLLAGVICITAGQSRCIWLLFGLCLGGLIGTKYTMAPVALVMFSACIVLSRPSADSIDSTPQISLFTRFVLAGSTATVFGGLWFLRNWLLIGNPVYPFATKFFKGGEWGPENDAFLTLRAGAKGFGKDMESLLLLPWNGTFRWISFETHNPGSLIILTLLVIGAALLFFRRYPLKGAVLFILLSMVTAFGVWFFSYQSNRLLLPVLTIALTLVPAGLYTRSRHPDKVLGMAALLFALAGFGWAVQWSWVATALSPPPLPYLTGQQDESTYRYKSLTYARAFDYLNERVAADEKVLLVGEHRIFGAEFQAVWSDWFDTPALVWLLREQKISTMAELLGYLRENRILWIMINERELQPQLERDFKPWFKPAEWQLFEELRQLSGDGIEVINMPPGATILKLEPSE